MAANVTDLELQHLTEDQLDQLIDILARSRANNPYERRLSREEARAFTLMDVEFDPEGSWVAYVGGEAVGFGSVVVEANRIAAGMDDGHVDVEVVPESRGQGIEQRLLEEAFRYLRSRCVGKAKTRSMFADVWRRSLYESNSFEEEFRVYSLVRRGRADVAPAPLPEGFSLDHRLLSECSDEQISVLVDAFNASFRDHFSFSPERPERWVNYRDHGEDIEMIALAMKDGQAVGVCVSEESRKLNEERGERTGWINILGVRPEHRRLGLGRALLADGMRWILGQGMDTVYLGVFARNEKALDLYRSFGFEKDRENIWYCKRLG